MTLFKRVPTSGGTKDFSRDRLRVYRFLACLYPLLFPAHGARHARYFCVFPVCKDGRLTMILSSQTWSRWQVMTHLLSLGWGIKYD